MASMDIQVNKISMRKYGVWYYQLDEEQRSEVMSIYYDFYQDAGSDRHEELAGEIQLPGRSVQQRATPE